MKVIEERVWFKDLYINHLIEIAKPLILKYKKLHVENIVFNFWFDNINFLTNKEIEEIINTFYKIESNIENIKNRLWLCYICYWLYFLMFMWFFERYK